MKIKMLILISLLLNLLSYGQNLVLNPGFEEINPNTTPLICAYLGSGKQFNQIAKNWQSFEMLTPDLLTIPKDSFSCLGIKAHNGQRSVGFITYHPMSDSGYDFDYHEFIQGKLKSPLQKGKTYHISFWLYTNRDLPAQHLRTIFGRDNHIVSVQSNNIGFSFQEIGINTKSSATKFIEDFDIKPQFNLEKIIDINDGQWHQYSGTFVADRAYRYFIIGNFYNDFRTLTSLGEAKTRAIDSLNSISPKEKQLSKTFWERTKRIAYYCVDDIEIIDEAYTNAILLTSLKEKHNYTFRQVQFEVGKANLVLESLYELDLLVKYLNENPKIKVEIIGYTDNIGSDEANQKLSEARAKAVLNYLVAQKVNSLQISSRGLGKANPIANNNSEEGRQLNRRVECKILE